MRKLKVSIYLAVFFCVGLVQVNAQKLAVSLGYEYFDKNAAFLGGEYRLDRNDLKNNHGPFSVGAGTYLYSKEGKFTIVPEAHIQKTWWHVVSSEFSVSTQNIKPSAGLSFFNLFRVQFGYSFPFETSDFKGFYFGFRLNIGRSPFYDEIRIF